MSWQRAGRPKRPSWASLQDSKALKNGSISLENGVGSGGDSADPDLEVVTSNGRSGTTLRYQRETSLENYLLAIYSLFVLL